MFFLNTRSRHIFILFLFWMSAIAAFFVKIYSLYPFLIEYFYSRDVFIKISEFQRKIFGSNSFNFGDFFFIIILAVCIYYIIKIILLVWNRKYSLIINIRTFYTISIVFFLNYVLFTVLWGLNFKRESVSKSMNLQVVSYYNIDQLKDFAGSLVADINICNLNIEDNQRYLDDFQMLAKLSSNKINSGLNHIVIKGFDSIHYKRPSIKKSVLTFFLNKMGIAGYHNPFTGEAVINSTIPNFLIPSAVVHEIVHQMGFAKESEAIFISYLFSKEPGSYFVCYSILMDLFISINSIIEKSDIVYSKDLFYKLNITAQRNIREYNNYIEKHIRFKEILSDNSYDFFININSKSQKTNKEDLISLLLSYQKTVDNI